MPRTAGIIIERHQFMRWFRAIAPVAAPVALLACTQAAAATIQVAKSPHCGCCEEWVEHMREAGFTVKVAHVEDVAPISKRLGVPDELRSCHTAKAGKYVIEGHVPAADVKRLLKEQPKALGIAVAGMPAGSPGMDQGSAKQPYKTILFTSDGTRVFAAH